MKPSSLKSFFSFLLAPSKQISDRQASTLANSKLNFEQLEQERKFSLIQALSVIMFGTSSYTIIFFMVIALITNQPIMFVFAGICIFSVVNIIAVYTLARKRQHYNVCVGIIIGNLLVILTFTSFLMGSGLCVEVCFLMPLALALVLVQNGRVIFSILGMSCLLTIALYVCQNLLKIYSPILTLEPDVQKLFSLILTLINLITPVSLLYLPIKLQLNLLSSQTLELKNALSNITTTQRNGQEVSREVLMLVSQLNTTAEEQASGSLEQVNTTTQINSSVQELSSTAAHIAEVAQQVDQAVLAMTRDSRQIENTTTASAEQTRHGLAAVNQTLEVSREVATLYRHLLAKSEELTERSDRMRRILEILSNIAKETQLLSLNAAIEAAGAGEHGDRFAVVAHEVKELSETSTKANKEIVGIIEEVETLSHELAQFAQIGNKRAEDLEIIANQTGMVIAGLDQVSKQAQEQAASITGQAEKVERLAEVIRISTAQQSSASQQVLLALNGLIQVAEQSASGSGVVLATADFLENLSQRLDQSLQAPVSEKVLAAV